VDVFIGHHANLSAVATARVAREEGKPFVLFLHGTGIEPRLHGHYDDRVWGLIEDAIHGAAGILVTTEYVRDELVRPLVDRPEEDFLVLPCGVDLVDFHPDNTAGIREKYDLPETYAICPGALTAVKGPQNVVQASSAYADLAPTMFIGDGELRDEVEQLIDRLGLRGVVRLLGWRRDVSDLLHAMDVFLLTSRFEGLPRALLQAMAAGVPVVATAVDGTPEVVRDRRTGLLIPPGDPQAAAEKVLELIRNPELRGRCVDGGRRMLPDQFDIHRMVSDLERIYISLLDR